MLDPPIRQSARQRKPTVPFDEQISQPSKLPEPTKAPKAPNTYPKPSKSTPRAFIQAKTSEDDAIQLLCDQAEGLDLNTPSAVNVIENIEDVENEKESVSDKYAKKA